MADSAAILYNGENIQYFLVEGSELAQMLKTGALKLVDFNRPIDYMRVEKLYEINRTNTIFAPSQITICKLGDGLYLVDGQHRIAVLAKMLDMGDFETTRSPKILVCQVECPDKRTLISTFHNVNSGQPVAAAYLDDIVKTTLSEFVGRLIGEFPACESHSAAPQRPNINRVATIETLSNYKELTRNIIDGKLSADMLFNFAIILNETMKSTYLTSGITATVTKRILDSAKKSGFYLALDKEWTIHFMSGLLSSLTK